MSDKYNVIVPDSISDDVKKIYFNLYDYSFQTAEYFYDSFQSKLEQIGFHPLSCAIDAVYPSLIEMGVRKGVINHDRHIVLYFIDGNDVIIITVERASRDYITTFESNLRLFEKNKDERGE